ncbi:RimK family alpha-L-glutamate ligase [Paenibacillus sp. J2TS4]|uniref:ATP-grasp domain-containing protein n=1 Tax=Paenibacillus sp. J2TS4 TaxID=2807194 RepID=UPI001B07BF00|nr:ATP-grasp domain-containing protein [Paenibacillus sp. J2TS4]GIP33308.1 hypothetical protein J2TS4_25180 [Paenibacillus sp. J2TS4]
MNRDLRIGIIGAANERHCKYMAREIERQGALPVILDNAPNLPFPLTMFSGGKEYDVHYQKSPLENIDVFFLRALFIPTPAIDTESIQQQIEEDGYVAIAAQRERYATWLAWLKNMPLQGKLLVNPVDTLLLHFAKPFQLESLRRAGLPIPKTLITGDGEQVLEFSRHRDVVYKPVAGGALCRLLSSEDKTKERLETLAHAPVLFQEYISGKDIRVFILDGEVIAAFEIAGGETDYREGETTLIPIRISDTIASFCILACRTLGLIFSGVDLKLCTDGSVVLIECNPSPMFEGFDRKAPVSIVSQLTQYLIRKARTTKQAVIR